MFDISFLKKSVASIGQQNKKLSADIEMHQRKREDIINAPATKEDLKAMVAAWCQERSGKYAEHLSAALGIFIRKPALMADQNRVAKFTVFGAQGSYLPGPALNDMVLCSLFGPALVTALHASIDAMEWPANALPIAGRAKQVEDLDARIGKLTKEQAELVAEARDAGVIFE
jgi:hypothetical protein